MDVGEEKHMCVAGSLSAKPGKVAEEGRSGWRWSWRWILGPKEARRGHIIIWNDYLANEPWGAGKLTAKQIKPAPDILMFFINKWWCQCVCVPVYVCVSLYQPTYLESTPHKYSELDWPNIDTLCEDAFWLLDIAFPCSLADHETWHFSETLIPLNRVPEERSQMPHDQSFRKLRDFGWWACKAWLPSICNKGRPSRQQAEMQIKKRKVGIKDDLSAGVI